ncbi:cell division protein [Burkholderia ubonensis]|uniref:SPOR domain-containing protein n=1 Tax=Burkholderia ubonensis TaxID=101571 RepID=UPI00075D6E2A|nr:SPOR domain-containing protein [Burkholderia ubonensis]KVC56965.1 cell division protein [Burkholderia ubonensis]KVD93200.1 cell division protein [Burkholderia ubonensis]
MAQPRRTSKQSKQAGGTFLGIVLGLIVGLAIAVVVALYITRSPSPFVSKVAPPPTDTGASQPQQFDPNRALQGKTPGQPVPQAAQPAPPNTAPGQAANQTQGGGLLPEPQIVEVPPSNGGANGSSGSNASNGANASNGSNGSHASNGSNNAANNSANNSANNGVAVPPKAADNTPPKKPQQQQQQQQQQAGEDDLARLAAQKQAQLQAAQKAQQQAAKPTSSTTVANNAGNGAKAPSAADANTGYFLQVGAYKTESDAEQQRARLGFQGFESKVSKRDVSGVTYFRVRVGPFSKFEDMNSARQRLSDAGVDTAVIRFTKQ